MPKVIKDKSYGTVVLSASNSVLLIKQLSQNGSYWALPKGHKEPGESDEQAAIRETNEECGTELTTMNLVPGLWHKESYKYKGVIHNDAWLKDSNYPNMALRPSVLYDKTVAYGLARIDSEVSVKPQLEEVEEVGWFPYDKAIQMLRHKSQQDAVSNLFNSISK